MKSFLYGVIKNRKATLFTAVILMVFGLYSYYIIPKQEAPDISIPVAVVTATYPGASPENVEELVTSKIEDKMVEIDGYDYTQSTSKNSLSVVFLMLDRDVDLDKAWQELRRKMDDLQSELPDGCGDIEINTDIMDTAGMMISMSGENYTYEELTEYAEDIKKELSKIKGISKFEITGKQEQEIKIEVDINKLNFYEISLDDVSQIIKAQNVEIPLGNIDDGDTKIGVRTIEAYSSIDEIQNIIVAVSKQNGSVVRLKDIAKIYIDYEDSNYKIKQNGKNAILLTGYFKENKNIVIIGKEVKEKIANLKKSLPDDIVFEESLFQPEDVSKSVTNFSINLLEGIVFVIIVVLIGMGFKNAIIVSTAIPLSIFMTFSAMNIFGIKIHQVSITALIIALGMLVDNAIVVSDAIQVRIDNGQEKLEACIEGVKEVAISVLTSTMTTVVAYIPLLPLNSDAGKYIRSIPQLVIISLISSYLVALFVTPTMAYVFFEKSIEKEKVSKIRKFFDRLLIYCMKRKKKTVVAVLLVLGFTGVVTNYLGLQFFPKADKDILYINVNAEQSLDINKTEEIVSRVTEILENEDEVVSYTAAIGDGLPKFYDTMQISSQSQDFAQIMVKVDLKTGKRFKTNTQLANFLQETFDSRVSGGTVIVKELEMGEPIGAPVRLRVSGDNMESLGEAAGIIKNSLRSIDGTINIDDDFAEKAYEFNIDFNEGKSSNFGISKYDIQNEVNIALMGRKTAVFRKKGKEYDIVVNSNIDSKENLENLKIKSSVTGNKVLLKEISDIRLKAQIQNIKKYDREKSVTIYSDVKSGYSSVKIQNELKNQISKMDLDDVDIIFDGEEEQINENFGDVGISAIFAVLMVYSVLLIQFNSFIQPIIILTTIPLSSIGSIIGLFIFRQPLSFTGLLGIVSLFGIVVNNAIVLIDYINYERKKEKSIEASCIEAVGRRFRPIMLSTTTTVIGLTPLIFSSSELFKPMAISLISGLMISTILTLVIIPMIYSTIEEKIENLKALRILLR